MLAAYHASWAEGDSDVIAAEVADLTELVDAVHEARDGELDLFIMGDFNLVPADLARTVHFAAGRTEGAGSTLNMAGEITANLYDHLLVVHEDASAEVLGNCEVRDVAASTADFLLTVSDHLPIVVRVAADARHDD
jgi:exonuclease III